MTDTVPAPLVMHPLFNPTAAMVSLVALLLSAATDIMALPNGALAALHVPAADIPTIQAVATVIIIAAGGHLSVARSLLPKVDNPA